MRKLILLLLVMCTVAMHLQGQTSTDNYVKTYTARVPTNGALDATAYVHKDSVQQQIQYLDGIGRGKQSIVRWGTPGGKDLISPIVFDNFGRQTKAYLPFTDNATTGALRTGPVTAQQSFYNQQYPDESNAGDYAFSEQQLEESPLGRILKQGAPGQVWQVSGSHTVDYDYRPNTVADTVKSLKVSAGNVIVIGQDYPANALWATQTSDENNGANEGVFTEFTDKRGRVVLKKVKETTTTDLSTYYVYDHRNRLRFVIPPAAVEEVINSNDWSLVNEDTFQQKWMYGYRYDARGRMIAKRVPGADWVHMIYDARDRLVLTQDGNQRADNVVEVNDTLVVSAYEGKNYQINGTGQFETTGYVEFGQHFEAGATVSAAPKRWIFTKYDELDRPVMTGFFYDEREAYQIQDELDSLDQFVTTYTGTGALMGYDNLAFPTGVTEENLLTVTYYDDYSFTNIDAIKPDSAFLQVRGQITGANTRVLGTSQWLETITFYDNRYRPIKVMTDNHKNGQDIIETDYRNEVSALVEEIRMYHTSDDYTGTLIVTETYTYDHLDRLLTQTHQINSGAVKTLVNNSYNELGELVSKTLGGTAQQVDYAYNIRGWLKTINRGAGISGTDKFGMELFYDEASQYNGNIGKMSWKSLGGSNVNEQTYDYTYDPLSRLKGATYQSTGQNGFFNVGNLQYDGNGNIVSLNRYQNVNGASKLIDALSYQYAEGNQLSSVQDNGDGALHTVTGKADVTQIKDLGFLDGNTTGADYLYDDNGNMIKDLNKGIDYINYNHLNLPERVTMDDGDYVKYVYDAAGIKLQKESRSGNNVTITDYVAGKHYVNNTLSFLQHAEGRTLYNAGAFDYEYNLTDHLGNVRVSVNEGGTVMQKDDYYPFGLTFNSWTNTSPENLYKYNGVELDKQTQTYETFFRGYDAALGRFHQIDPLTEIIPSISSYHFGFNNPVIFNDPLGLMGEDYKIKKGGKDRKRRRKDRRRNNDKDGRGNGHNPGPKPKPKPPKGSGKPDSGDTSNDPSRVKHDDANSTTIKVDNAGKDLIDLSKSTAGQEIVDYLRDFNIRNQLGKRLPAGQRERKPYLHEFIDLSTKFPNLGRELARFGGGGWSSQISGPDIEVLDELFDVWVIYRPGTKHKFSTDNQVHGYTLATKTTKEWLKSIYIYEVIVKNGDGKGLIIFRSKSKTATQGLFNYIRGK